MGLMFFAVVGFRKAASHANRVLLAKYFITWDFTLAFGETGVDCRSCASTSSQILAPLAIGSLVPQWGSVRRLDSLGSFFRWAISEIGPS